MASTSDIRNGLCIKYNHDIFKIIEFLHVKPGKGPAFVRTKMRVLFQASREAWKRTRICKNKNEECHKRKSN